MKNTIFGALAFTIGGIIGCVTGMFIEQKRVSKQFNEIIERINDIVEDLNDKGKEPAETSEKEDEDNDIRITVLSPEYGETEPEDLPEFDGRKLREAYGDPITEDEEAFGIIEIEEDVALEMEDMGFWPMLPLYFSLDSHMMYDDFDEPVDNPIPLIGLDTKGFIDRLGKYPLTSVYYKNNLKHALYCVYIKEHYCPEDD